MSELSKQIRDLLVSTDGNIERVAESLGISTRYVQAVEAEMGRTLKDAMAVTAPPPVDVLALVSRVVPPAAQAITGLRDEILSQLMERVKAPEVTVGDLLAVLDRLTKYENHYHEVAQAAAGTAVHQQTIQYNTTYASFVQQLSDEFPPEVLRQVAGVPKANTIILDG